MANNNYLVVDLSPAIVCIGVASDTDECHHLIADFTGRVVHSLDAPYLWQERDGLASLPARILELQTFLEHREGPLENVASVQAAVMSLVIGIKSFAESREERPFQDIVIAHPHSFPESSRELVKECWRQAGSTVYRRFDKCVAAMEGYDLDAIGPEAHALVVNVTATRVEGSIYNLEEGIFERLHTADIIRKPCENLPVSVRQAVETALSASQFARDRIDHLLFTGDLLTEIADTVGKDMLLECLPSARLHTDVPPNQVAAVGMMHLMRRIFCRVYSPSELICCMIVNTFTIGLEVADGLCEPLLARHSIFPRSERTTVRVYCGEPDKSVVLRFCEGERDFYADNMALGVVRLRGLCVGWNDVQIYLDMPQDSHLHIDVTAFTEATANGTLHEQLIVASPPRTMDGREVNQYFEELEHVPTLADEAADRERVEARLCTEALVAAACEELGRGVPIASHGEVRVVRFQLSDRPVTETDSQVETTSSLELRDLLDHVADERDDIDEETLHNAATEYFGDRLQWLGRFRRHRCRHCLRRETVS